MNVNEWVKEIHRNAVEHGWWDEDRTLAEIIALCHSELSEALEEDRKGNPMVYYVCENNGLPCEELKCMDYDPDDHDCEIFKLNPKPEGIATEMADCVIRIFDWAGKMGIDLERIIREKHEYNRTRPYKHGKRY